MAPSSDYKEVPNTVVSTKYVQMLKLISSRRVARDRQKPSRELLESNSF